MALVKVLIPIIFLSSGLNDYITKGNQSFVSSNYKNAARLYMKAIDYNIPITLKMVLYWKLHLCYDKLNLRDNSASSLLGFIVNGLLVKQYIQELSEKEIQDNSTVLLVKYFKLDSKLSYASSKLGDLWYESKTQ